MSLKLGNSAINKIYLGNTEIKKMYLGSTLVYDKTVQYLLDTHPATVAYSLRQLKTGITNVVRVRRSSDNAEQDFTASQITDGTLTTFTGAGNGFVTTWYDQSGNGYDVTQTNQARQPRIVISGVLQLLNSAPAIKYDGSNDCLINTTFFTSATAITFLSVSSYSTSAGTGASIVLIPVNFAPPTNIVFEVFFADIPGYFDVGSTTYPARSYQIGSNIVNTAGSQVLFFESYNGLGNADLANYTMSLDGGTLTVSNGGALGYFTEYFSVGGRTQQQLVMFPGLIQEVIFYESDQTANRTAIESNINTHYTIY